MANEFKPQMDGNAGPQPKKRRKANANAANANAVSNTTSNAKEQVRYQNYNYNFFKNTSVMTLHNNFYQKRKTQFFKHFEEKHNFNV